MITALCFLVAIGFFALALTKYYAQYWLDLTEFLDERDRKIINKFDKSKRVIL